MSFIVRILRRESRALDMTNANWLVALAPTAAGPSVTPATAMRSATAAACIRGISETMALLPAHLFSRSGDSRTRDRTHPVARVLERPNPWTSWPELVAAVTTDALTMDAGGFVQVLRVRGEVRELHRLAPGSVRWEVADDGSPTYTVTTRGGGQTVLHWRDVIHVTTPGTTPDRRMCALSMAREAIGLDLAMSGHSGRTFRNGGRPSGILRTAKKLTPESMKRIGESWTASHGGENSGRTAILEEDMNFQPLAASFVDSEFTAQRRLVIEEIARAFRVPPVIIGDLSRATYSNGETMGRLFLTHCLAAWVDVWGAALERALLSDAERADRFVEIETAALLEGDTASRFTAYRTASGAAWLTPNEVRQRENLPPVAGGDELVRQAGQAGAAANPEGAADES